MDSPPSCSASEMFPTSEDSGLLLTSGHSDSVSSCSDGFCHIALELAESEDEQFDTIRRGEWTISPPPEFQDDPLQFHMPVIEKFAARIVSQLVKEALIVSSRLTWSIPCSAECHMSDNLRPTKMGSWSGLRLCWTPDTHPYSPCHGARPGSRVSIASSRLSSSHNSLSVPAANRVDDSSFITSAMSHDTLASSSPFDSEIYTLPVEEQPRPPHRIKRPSRRPQVDSEQYSLPVSSQCHSLRPKTGGKRPLSQRSASVGEPIHMTLLEVRQYLHTLYCRADERPHTNTVNSVCGVKHEWKRYDELTKKNKKKVKKKIKEKEIEEKVEVKGKKLFHGSFPSSLKRTLCNLFQLRKLPSPDQCMGGKREPSVYSDEIGTRLSCHVDRNPPSPITKPPFTKRALPPLPPAVEPTLHVLTPEPEEGSLDFASSIQKVKDYGWYWGPVSGEAAEKILSNEPDGSFIVRDSSDDYYIFSLTFKLNSIVRHVRIEHDQGNFSFGSSTRFKSHTIVDFIESAVEHSRSGRYLFFLHRRPVLGPMRVQLLHPVSRFKHVQSLQHMCRFVILKNVRRDLIPSLPLPRRLLDYLSTPHYYSETLVDEENTEQTQKQPIIS